jgi:aminoglycoside phosphotransferase (APT) family kinase protein
MAHLRFRTPAPPVLDLARVVARFYRDGVNSAAFNGWTVEEAARGYNGIVFRVRSEDADLAAKVSQIDERDRAGRELAALELLDRHGVAVAPEPVGVVHAPDGISVDVMFARWRPGTPLAEPPSPGSSVWRTILEAYATFHRLGIADGGAPLRPAVLGVDLYQVVDDMRDRARQHGDLDSDGLIAAAERSIHATLPTVQSRCLIQCDANLQNVLLDGSGEAVTIVDWENSGWGDPCFDLANILMTPQLADRTVEEWEPLFAAHAELLGDSRLADRTRAHACVISAWWVVRLRQEIAAPTPRLPGVVRPGERTRKELVALCEERAATLLSW